ncbi:MAG: glycosyltransferase family 2 protein [Desulfobaccales bacterium]
MAAPTPRLSVIVIALNQEAHLKACLETVRFAEEIVVVDSGSTDGTVTVARQFTDRVISTQWRGFGATKNFALDQARGRWIFSLDTDERVPPALAAEIEAVVAADGPFMGYRVPRKNYFGGRWVRWGGWYPDLTLRLFRREAGRFVEREVHEEVRVPGPVGRLRTPLLHYTYTGVRDYVARMDRYARLAATEMLKQGRRPRPGETLWRPWGAFLKSYVWRLGFLEGELGFTLARLAAMYTFLKYAYLRELLQEKDAQWEEGRPREG